MTTKPAPAPVTPDQWKALLAAQAGYLLDAMDVLLYVFAINAIKQEFGLSNQMAGLVGSTTLIASAIGGTLCGALADRLGRTRMLTYTILLYSLASAGTATARSFGELVFWRALVGFAMGGEWSAGAVLVSETWPAERRGQAIGWMQSCWALGYMLAAAVAALVLPRFGWRVLFLTGLAPALVALAIRRDVPEPALWKAKSMAGPAGQGSWMQIFRPPLARRTLAATALTTSVLFAYWGLFTWIPSFLGTSRAEGGAGLSILGTSAFVFPMQAGAFLGYVTFGAIADRFGRRPAFLLYVLASAALVPLYGHAGSERLLLLLGPLIGFFGSGYFSLFGAMLAEIYPTAVRGAGQGFSYNFGRGLSALAPFAIGAVADRSGIGAALAWNSGFFLLAAALIFTLPETRRMELA